MNNNISTIKILHLEDRQEDADQIARLLRKGSRETFDIKVVDDKEGFKKALMEFIPDLVISDHNLPSFNSIEALQFLKSSGLKIPFILVTGTVSEEFAVEAMRTGADDYILKDRMHRLPNAIASALSKYRLNEEQRETEMKIRESEAKFRSFFENSMDGILLSVVDGEIVSANPAACQMFQMSEREICATETVNLIDPLDTRVTHLREERKQRGRCKGELTFVRKSGDKFPGELTLSVFKDSSGRDMMSVIFRDITERKRSETEAIKLVEKLQRQNNDLQQFSYIVSHNLRAPISKILGLTSIIESDSDENKILIEKIFEEAASLDNIIRDINAIVSARKFDKEKMESVSFELELNLVLQILETELLKSRAKVRYNFAVQGIIAIRSYVHSILYNLISNAVKYRHPERILQIVVETAMVDEFIRLTVEDNGLGIDLTKTENKLFGLYKRFHGNSVPGKGVGLSLVKTHVESLGGRIEVKSGPDAGTLFSIYLPNEYGKEGIS